MADPARSDLLTDEWELRWTDEKEVNFAVANGLFGLPWIRTYQTIDVPGGRLVNGERDRFRGGGRAARVLEHRARPDRRRAIQLRVRRVQPLPPVGWGWGELLRLCRTKPLPAAATSPDRGCDA